MTADLGALAPIAARKAVEAESLRCAAAGLWGKAETLPPARSVDVLRGGTVIAELKRRSPSGGILRADLDPQSMARDYAAAGAAAISVLTDGPDFGGTLDDLQAVRDAVDVPLLRKDFVVDPVQVAEARVGGADWMLLIVALLDQHMLDACLEAASRCGAGTIVEVHSVDECIRALDAGATCIGVNNRDLRTLKTDLATFSAIRAHVSQGTVVVAESGVRAPADVERLVGEGADAVLVGEALLRAQSPADLCAGMVSAARSAARSRA